MIMYLLKFINVYTVQGCTSTQDKSNLLVSLRVTENFSSDMFKKISSSCLYPSRLRILLCISLQSSMCARSKRKNNEEKCDTS